MTINELYQIIGDLNAEIFEKDEKLAQRYAFILGSTACADWIKFNDVLIWSSENDEREYTYIGEEEELENLKEFCKKQALKFAKDINILLL